MQLSGTYHYPTGETLQQHEATPERKAADSAAKSAFDQLTAVFVTMDASCTEIEGNLHEFICWRKRSRDAIRDNLGSRAEGPTHTITRWQDPYPQSPSCAAN